jgi:hypothetical protein
MKSLFPLRGSMMSKEYSLKDVHCVHPELIVKPSVHKTRRGRPLLGV